MQRNETWLMVATMALAVCRICAAEVPRCSEWELVNPRPQANHLRDVAFGGGRWVAVGEGVAVVSTDAVTWTSVPVSGYSLRGVAYGDGAFVAVGDGGVIVRSADGARWEVVEAPTTVPLNAVAFVGGEFVAVGAATTVLSSSDGFAWTSERPAELHGDLLGVRESGTFAGNPGPMFIIWGPASIALRRLDATWVAISVPGDVTVAEGAFSINGSIISTFNCFDCFWCWPYGTCFHETRDGTTWTTPFSGLPRGPYDVAAKGSGLIGVVWNDIAQLSYLWTSPDGLAWHQTSTQFDPRVRALSRGGGWFVGVGDHGAIWTSTNGTSWRSASGPTPRLYRVSWNERAFTANLYSGAPGPPGSTSWEGFSLASSDGRAWRPVATAGIEAVAARPGLFLGVREKEVFSSADGLEWIAREPLPTAGAPGAVWDGRRFVILNWQGFCSVTCDPTPVYSNLSEDLSTWVAVEQPALLGDWLQLGGLAFNGERYVAPGGWTWSKPGSGETSYAIRVSEDGLTWRKFPPPVPIATNSRTGIASDDHAFVVVNDTTVLTSPDGLAWSSTDIAPLHLVGVMWTGDEYVGVGDDGAGHAAIARSPDGVAWTHEAFQAIPARLLAVAGGRRVQLAVGAAGLTLRRECHPQAPSRRLRGPR